MILPGKNHGVTRFVALTLILLLTSAPVFAGLSINNANGIVMTGADGIVMTGADGIVMTGADSVFNNQTNGIVMTGADGIVMTGAAGWAYPNSVRAANADGIVMTGADGIVMRSEERRVGKECRSRWSPYH